MSEGHPAEKSFKSFFVRSLRKREITIGRERPKRIIYRFGWWICRSKKIRTREHLQFDGKCLHEVLSTLRDHYGFNLELPTANRQRLRHCVTNICARIFSVPRVCISDVFCCLFYIGGLVSVIFNGSCCLGGWMMRGGGGGEHEGDNSKVCEPYCNETLIFLTF